MRETKKNGRPTELDCQTNRHSVSLDEETADKAKILGRGNLSAGIREAVRRVKDVKETEQ